MYIDFDTAFWIVNAFDPYTAGSMLRGKITPGQAIDLHNAMRIKEAAERLWIENYVRNIPMPYVKLR